MPSANILAESNFNVGMDEWDEWMKWEGPPTEYVPSLYNEYSNDHKDNPWPQNVSSKTQLDTFDQMAIDDFSYEFDDSTTVPELDLGMTSPVTPLLPLQRRPFQGYSSLTVAEERELRGIAMPNRKESVVSTAEEDRESSCSPEPTTRSRGKKRKSSTKGDEGDDKDLCQSRKRGHNAIEKRYRTNLNEKICLLRQSIPSLRVLPEGETMNEDDCEKSREAAEKSGKAVILTRAVEYISHLEDCTERLGRETLALKARIAAFEKLATSGSIQMGGVQNSTIPTDETLESIKAGMCPLSDLLLDRA